MTILIADDHILFRDTLVTYLSIAKPLQKTVTVNDFHSLFEHIEKSHLKIDFMLIDFSMPDMAGREAFQKLAKHPSNIPYAMMSGVAERDDIEFVMALGARGYLPKTMSGQVLIQAIDKMMAGQIYMPPHDPLSLFAPPPPSSLQVKAQSVDIFQLTPRQQDVLNLL
ncbi:MAG: response regulator transcription factor [bacterium]